MEDKTIIAAILIIIVTLLQIVSWLLGYDGQVTIIVSNVIAVMLTYYFVKAKLK